MLSGNGWEAYEKIIDRFAGLEIVEQRLHGDSCPVEYGGAPHDVRADGDDWLFHVGRLHLQAEYAQMGRAGKIVEQLDVRTLLAELSDD